MSNPIEIAFSSSVKDIQTRKGSRQHYQQFAEQGTWTDQLDQAAAAFIERQTTCYIGTANALGQPYIQHRGGPPGFMRVLDPQTVAFTDFKGNRQFITQGNLQDNPQAFIFLMDYANRRRLKLWGHASVIEHDMPLAQQLMPANYSAQAEQVIAFRISLYDYNCSSHIPHLVDAETAIQAIAERDRRIVELEDALARLKNQ